jgi:oligoribonuclease
MLEVCLIVTDRALNELGRYSAVVDFGDLSFLSVLSPFVAEMHVKSGLLAALQDRAQTVPLEEIERELCQLLVDTAVVDGDLDTRPIVWAGFSPSALDRPMVHHYMPTFYSKIHYRTIDVSSEKLTALNYFGVKLDREEVAHRAERDTEDTIEAFRQITALISKKTRRRDRTRPFPAKA